jgi:hypothetical protein
MGLISQFARELSWQSKSVLRYSPALGSKRGIRNTDQVTSCFSPAALNRLQELQEIYALHDWPQLCNATEYVENLYLLDLLDHYVEPLLVKGKGMDIGCRNFSHLPALSAFNSAGWIGVELDAHARYLNGFTRRAYGEWMASQRAQCQFVAGSLLEVREEVSLIVWILPFVLPEPLQHWGLPDRFYQPEALLKHAVSLLRETGVMLVINQGEEEFCAQQNLFAQAGLSAISLGEVNSEFSHFRQPRFASLFKK